MAPAGRAPALAPSRGWLLVLVGNCPRPGSEAQQKARVRNANPVRLLTHNTDCLSVQQLILVALTQLHRRLLSWSSTEIRAVRATVCNRQQITVIQIT